MRPTPRAPISPAAIASSVEARTARAPPPTPPALFVLAPVVSVAGLSLFVLRRKTRLPLAILVPVVWVASEVVLNYMSDLAFPWLPLGLALARTPVLAQMADLSGVRGLSFLIAAVNGLIADAWLLRGQRAAIAKRLVGAVAIVAVMVAYGAWRMRTTE